MFAVFVSSIAMLLETPYLMVFDNLWLSIIEYVYIAIISCEFILHVIADGVLFCPHAFLRNFKGWFKLIQLSVAIVHLVYFWNISPIQ